MPGPYAVRVKQADGTWQDLAIAGPQGAPGPGIVVKGNVDNQAALPPTGNAAGDAYQTNNDGHLWSWSGTAWVDAGLFRGPMGYDTAPIGAVISTTRSTWSDEYVLANGQSLTEAAYPDALAVAVAEVAAGNPFWTVSGTAPSRTFTVPDLRNRFLYGAGTKTIGIKSQTDPALANPGEETHLTLLTEIPSHSHGGATGTGVTGTGQTGTDSANHTHVLDGGGAGGVATGVVYGAGSYAQFVVGGGAAWMSTTGPTGGVSNWHSHSVPALSVPALSITAQGGGVAHNNMPPYAVLSYIIKVRGASISANVVTGPTGAPGAGVPVGGTTGQALVKKSATDFDTEWGAAVGGGGGGTGLPEIHVGPSAPPSTQVLWVDTDETSWAAPTYVAALPPYPFDGQEVYYVASATDGVIWHLRYNVASASIYKWEFIGGSGLTARVTAQAAFASSAGWLNPASAGPSLAVPLSGEYECLATCLGYANSTAGYVAMGVCIGDTVPDNGSEAYVYCATTVRWMPLVTSPFKTLTAGQIVKLRFYSDSTSGGFATVTNRALILRPVRVG